MCVSLSAQAGSTAILENAMFALQVLTLLKDKKPYLTVQPNISLVTAHKQFNEVLVILGIFNNEPSFDLSYSLYLFICLSHFLTLTCANFDA